MVCGGKTLDKKPIAAVSEKLAFTVNGSAPRDGSRAEGGPSSVGVQGSPGGDARGRPLLPAGGLARRTPWKALCIQSRTTRRMPPHQPAWMAKPARCLKGPVVEAQVSEDPMSLSRDAMIAELKRVAVPVLRSLGFGDRSRISVG